MTNVQQTLGATWLRRGLRNLRCMPSTPVLLVKKIGKI